MPYPESSPAYIPDDVLVVCPRCERRALVQTGGDDYDRPLRLSCTHCSYSREAELKGGALRSWAFRKDGRDGLFGQPLWLTEECCGGNLLWAYNEAHLDYLERFIASKNRDHDFPSPPGNRGLSYKLPKWMQVASHRDELLRAIARLRQRLA